MNGSGPQPSRVVFDTAIRAAVSLWWGGCRARALCVAGMWCLLPWVGVADLPRAVLQLSAAALGVGVGFLHMSAGAMDRLTRWPRADRLVQHLAGTTGRVTVDLSGMAEGIGVLTSSWLFVGPVPLEGLPVAVRTLGIAFGVVYAWDAYLQAMIDPGWYNPDARPSRTMRALRVACPFILASVLLADLWPWNAATGQVPLTARFFLVLCPFLYLPAWAAFEVMLRATAGQLSNAESLWRQGAATDLHSMVKNSVGTLRQYVEEPEPQLEEIRGLARTAMLLVEELRQDLLAPRDHNEPQGFGDLWTVIMKVFPAPQRRKCRLHDASGTVLSSTDYQLARQVLPDLLSNALKAGAGQVTVSCGQRAAGVRTVIFIEVADDGPGIDEDVLADPTSSMHLLHRRISRFGGGIHWHRASGMTVVSADWALHDDSSGDGMARALTAKEG